jgi:hypothetical protein
LTLSGSFKINDSKGEYAIYYDAVYRSFIKDLLCPSAENGFDPYKVSCMYF